MKNENQMIAITKTLVRNHFGVTFLPSEEIDDGRDMIMEISALDAEDYDFFPQFIIHVAFNSNDPDVLGIVCELDENIDVITKVIPIAAKNALLESDDDEDTDAQIMAEFLDQVHELQLLTNAAKEIKKNVAQSLFS